MYFSVNFMSRATAVLTEASKLKKYKAMPIALAILVGIFMLPCVLVSLFCAAIVYIMGYFFSVVSLPIQRLHKLLRDEGQAVQHGTQFIIYFISWSFVFTVYAMLSFFLIMLTVLYSVFSIFTYIWTLGGFKFHVFANDEDISVEVNGKYSTIIPVVFVVIMAFMWMMLPAFNAISTIIDYQADFTLELFSDLYEYESSALYGWRMLVSGLYSAFLFAPNPKKDEE